MRRLLKQSLRSGAAILLIAGCQEAVAPVVKEQEEGPPAAAVLSHLTCEVNVNVAAMTCEPVVPKPTGVAGVNMDLIVGGQHQFVRLANAPPSTAGGVWTANVTVQNLTLQPMGTEDGSTATAAGVRVFFVQEPTSGVVIANHDGAAAFTGSEPQKYYEYAGPTLGGDGILAPGEVSTAKPWQFTLNGATTFRFSVLVSTAVPNENSYGTHLTRIAGNSTHTCGDGADGKVYCWGRNESGALGDGTEIDRATPVAVRAPAGVSLSGVTVGTYHTCANGSNDTVYCWGLSYYGQLGNGSSGNGQYSTIPVAVQAPGGITLSGVKAGGYFSCATGSDNSIYCWGRNDSFQLGDSTATLRVRPVPVTAPAGVTLSGVSTANAHSCAQGSDGNAYCWGVNGSGQLGDSTTVNKRMPTIVRAPAGVSLTSIVAGGSHTCAQGSDGQSYCWGSNGSGQLGMGHTFSAPIPLPVSAPPGVTLSAFALGNVHTCASGSDGKTWCWGNNASGQLGIGSVSNRTTPAQVVEPTGVSFQSVAAGGSHTCARGSDGKSYCWGRNVESQLGTARPTSATAPEVVAGTRRP